MPLPNNKTDRENSQYSTNSVKSPHALREEAILKYWKENSVFEKSLGKESPKGEFVFYEGPPTANGRPGIHHLEARAFKDAIPRYKTMQGYHVRRKGGWDTHGLPVELQVEKELGLKSKKEIESYGIGLFNEKCKASVWKYVHEWEDFTDRMGYWVDLENPYITYKSQYIESVWSIIKTAENKKLLYKDYKVVPWCPRCGTGLSSHELAQGYETVKDLSVYVKFEVVGEANTYLLAWTTTPWTLPGNVGLAINADIEYVKVKVASGEVVILAKERFEALKSHFENASVLETVKGGTLVGLAYNPLYPFLKDNVQGTEKEKLANAYRVYAAPFVTTSDGTGIVHIAVMYGQDDFELGTKVGLPKFHLVNDDGTFKKEAGSLAGLFVKDPGTDVTIIKDLAGRKLLFAKEKYEHTYPFCWRCHTPLIYFARDSWYLRMSSLRDTLVKENEGIHWEPEHIKEGRFGEWLREIKDWAISRERYWGTPLPVWTCEKCKSTRVVGVVSELAKRSKNKYLVMRHGEAENNVRNILDTAATSIINLTEKGEKDVSDSAAKLVSSKIDLIFTSPLLRTRETAEIVRDVVGLDSSRVIVDDRIREYGAGIFDGKGVDELARACGENDRWLWKPEGGEDYMDIKRRMGEFLYDMESKYEGKTILIVTHETPAYTLFAAAAGHDIDSARIYRKQEDFIANAEVRPVDFSILPHNADYELDLHKPFIDDVKLDCQCGGTMSRAREVLDVWFDSGSMPFSQEHELGGNEEIGRDIAYPADFISEAIDQTRGWFYTLHAIGAIMGKGKAYKNVICLGHILDAKGKKMSKSIGNVVSPWDMMDKYGADALRFWMYSVNQPGDSKNFDEKTVDEVVKKVFNLISNVTAFYKLYENRSVEELGDATLEKRAVDRSLSSNILDRWIIAKLSQLIETTTKNLDNYKFFEPTRAIRDFIAELSQWYLRRSRDRFKNDGVDKIQALSTTRYVLSTLARLMAPFTPLYAEYLHQELFGSTNSVHLTSWPEVGKSDAKLIENMQIVRDIASKGLEARMKAKINVRQPLAKLTVNNTEKSAGLSPEFCELIMDEVNVKEVMFLAGLTQEVELDIAITPALKEEGTVRELIRVIQDLRKDRGFTVNDKVSLIVDTDVAGKTFIEKNEKAISAATSVKGISFSSVTGESQAVGELNVKLDIR
ncbi:MAG: class I tRNA ligase family protein [Candidatus Taylorbacteria bacterium]